MHSIISQREWRDFHISFDSLHQKQHEEQLRKQSVGQRWTFHSKLFDATQEKRVQLKKNKCANKPKNNGTRVIQSLRASSWVFFRTISQNFSALYGKHLKFNIIKTRVSLSLAAPKLTLSGSLYLCSWQLHFPACSGPKPWCYP